MSGHNKIDAFWQRYQKDHVATMSHHQFGDWLDHLPLPEFLAMIDAHGPTKQTTKGQKPARHQRKTPSLPLAIKSDDICKELVCIAAFNLFDSPDAQKKVYRAVRALQKLDAAAVEAGILSR